MAQIHLNTSSVHLGGIDLSGYVKDVAVVDLDPWQQRVLDGLPTGRITIDFRSGSDDDTWWQAWEQAQAYWRERRRQRISRMHVAYRRRRR